MSVVRGRIQVAGDSLQSCHSISTGKEGLEINRSTDPSVEQNDCVARYSQKQKSRPIQQQILKAVRTPTPEKKIQTSFLFWGAQNRVPCLQKNSSFSSQVQLHHCAAVQGWLYLSFALHLCVLSDILVSFQLYLNVF